MGFKDVALFNDVLLAKQAWRLLHHKESLFYRVFKSKFFRNCSFMETGSYAWHSILKGRDFISRGAKWKIGNGESIGVWMDARLPPREHPRILSLTVECFKEARVIDLIDSELRQWDLNLLHSLFNPNEVEMI